MPGPVYHNGLYCRQVSWLPLSSQNLGPSKRLIVAADSTTDSLGSGSSSSTTDGRDDVGCGWDENILLEDEDDRARRDEVQ